jgi:peptide/nickel transport system ATP-binding protein
MGRMDKLLEVNQLTKVFTLGSIVSRVRITAVDQVSFHVKPGEIFALAGESGCGKSTTARIILGFERPTSGAIVHKGKPGRKSQAGKVWFSEGIQAIFQDPFSTFNPLRTIDSYFFETVRYYRLAANRAEAEKRIDQTLQAVGLSYEELAGRFPAGNCSASPLPGRSSQTRS